MSVRVRNTGTVVDQFTATVLGQPAAWTTAVPASLSLFPGADGTIELHFAPPRSPDVGSGGVPFAVRVDASQDPDGSVVEEGEVHLLPFVDVQAKLTPRTSEAKRKTRHEVIIDNRGNADIETELTASDPDEHLAFELRPRTVMVPAGQSAHVLVKVAAVKGFMRGPDKQRPFQVKVTPPGESYPITLDGALMQKSGTPKFLFPLVACVIAVGLIAVLVPMFKKDASSGKLSLTSETGATTTPADPGAPADAAPDPNAPATPEEAAAAAEAEAAANGKDGSSVTTAPTSGGGGQTAAGVGTATVASGGGSAPATTVASGNESPTVTSPTATTAAPPPGGAAGTTTTAAPAATTTTAPQSVDMYYVVRQENDRAAHWHSGGNAVVGQMFRANGTTITEAWLNLAGDNVVFNIRSRGPGGPLLGSSRSVAIEDFGMTKVVFEKPIPVTSGAIYYLEGVATGQTWAWYSNTDDYRDGDGYFNNTAHGHDLNARVIGRQ